MDNFQSGNKNNAVLLIIGGFLFTTLLLVVSWLSVTVFLDPAPFVSYPKDLRWLVFYGAGLILIGGLALLRQVKLLIIGSIIGWLILAVTSFLVYRSALSILMLFWLLVTGCALGDWFLIKLQFIRFFSFGERIVVSLAFGWAVFMLMMLVLGLTDLYYSAIIYILLILCGLLTIPGWIKSIKANISIKSISLWHSSSISLGVGLGLSLLLMIFSLFWALTPSIRYDALTYHLAGPEVYVENHGLVNIPEAGNNAWTHYADSMFTLALLTSGQPLPGLMHLVMAIFSTALTFYIAKRYVSNWVGWMAALLFFSTPLVSYESATVYIDFFVCFYILCAFFTMILTWETQNQRFLVLAGIFSGIALGIKLTAAPALAAGWLLFIIASRRTFQPSSRILRNIFFAGMLAIVIALPWFIRDYYWTGDPFFPFGIEFQRRLASSAIDSPDGVNLPIQSSKLIKFLRYPWDLTFNSRKYYHESPGYILGALPMLWLPWLYFGARHYSLAQKKRFGWMVTCVLLGFGIISALVVPLARYISPFYPFMAIGMALNFEVVWLSIKKTNYQKMLSFLAVLCLFVYIFSTRLALTVRAYDLPERVPYRYVAGLESQESFLRRTLVVYPAYEFLDQQGDGVHKVLSIGNEFRLYTKSNIDAVWNSPNAYNLLVQAKDSLDLAIKMREAGYDYLLINQREQSFRPTKYEYASLSPEFMKQYMHLEFVQDGIYIYRFLPAGRPGLVESNNLLQNAGFESTTQTDGLDPWNSSGMVTRESNPVNVDAGLASVKLMGSGLPEKYGFVYQDVEVVDDGFYTLVYQVKAEQTATIQMQVSWLDSQHTVIRTDYEFMPATPDEGWKRKAFSTVRPIDAIYARVYVSLNGNATAWFDNICFAAGDYCQ